jgi:hypothetical protein
VDLFAQPDVLANKFAPTVVLSQDLRIAPRLARFANIKPLKAAEM